MKNGDISNKHAPIIVFNADNLIYKKAPVKGITDKVSNYLFGDKYEIDCNFILTINGIVNNQDVNVFLMTADPPYLKDMIEQEHILLYYSEIVKRLSARELRHYLDVEYYMYADNDWGFLATINHAWAFHIDDLSKYLKMGRVRG